MKYLDLAPLTRLSSFLEHVDCGDYTVHGDLEAYSCKLAGFDKKLSKSLEHEVVLGSSPLELASSPLGPLSEASSRKTLIYLILTLNHIYPDYDFSLLRSHHFRKQHGIAQAEQLVDSSLLEVAKAWSHTPGLGDMPFLETVWSSIEEVMTLKDCDVYEYTPDSDTDPFGDKPPVWSFNYFFYNKKMKRILYFSCRAVSKLNRADDEDSTSCSEYQYNSDEETVDRDYGMADDMDV